MTEFKDQWTLRNSIHQILCGWFENSFWWLNFLYMWISKIIWAINTAENIHFNCDNIADMSKMLLFIYAIHLDMVPVTDTITRKVWLSSALLWWCGQICQHSLCHFTLPLSIKMNEATTTVHLKIVEIFIKDKKSMHGWSTRHIVQFFANFSWLSIIQEVNNAWQQHMSSRTM